MIEPRLHLPKMVLNKVGEIQDLVLHNKLQGIIIY